MTVVKVCGLREAPHMLAAAEAGAELLGMVFVPGVRRQITPEAAREMVRALRDSREAQGSVAPGSQGLVARELGISAGAGLALPWVQGFTLVGLFADQPDSDVNQVAELVDLDAVQLCGDEPPDYWARIERPILKVVHVPAVAPDDDAGRFAVVASLAEALRHVADAGHMAVLDRQSDARSFTGRTQPGGTGRTFDWSIARDLADLGHRFLLAGGLTPENVGSAVETVAPFGVDVSSGVETGGVKDVERIRGFVAAARRGESSNG